MQAASRLGLAFLLLIAAFVTLIGFAVWMLVGAGQATVAVVVAVAGLAGVAAGAVTYFLVRRDAEVAEYAIEPLLPMESELPRRPLRVQTMPVADLPPAYLAAVTKGAQARLSALKGQSLRH